MIQDTTEIPQALDVINPVEGVIPPPEMTSTQQSKGRFSDSDRMAANNIFRTEEERNESMKMGSQIINNKIA